MRCLLYPLAADLPGRCDFANVVRQNRIGDKPRWDLNLKQREASVQHSSVVRVYKNLKYGQRNRGSRVNNRYPRFVPPARISGCSFAAERVGFSAVPASIKPPGADEILFHFTGSLENAVLNPPKQVIYLLDPRGGIEQL